MSWRIHQGDLKALEILRDMPDNSMDACLCDPPYGLSPDGRARDWDTIDATRVRGGFMGKDWDAAVPGPTFWREVLRVLKPGAPVMAFCGTRTYHRMASAIEDAGFLIRDQIDWIYGSGFPKSLNISKAIDNAAGAERPVVGTWVPGGTARPREGGGGHGAAFTNAAVTSQFIDCTLPLTAPSTDLAKQWDGYGTALKPAHENVCFAMKPTEGTYAENAAKWGVAGLAIDAGRVGTETVGWGGGAAGGVTWDESNCGLSNDGAARPVHGRWPANLIFDEAAAEMLDEAVGDRPSTLTGRADPLASHINPSTAKSIGFLGTRTMGGSRVYADSGSASRFFYTAKVSRREREYGLAAFDVVPAGESVGREEGSAGLDSPRAGASRTGGARNVHPTLKPLSLTKYLAGLILPPKRSDGSARRLLVPFSGAGSEVIGALQAGWDDVTGVEQSQLYIDIAEARIAAWMAVEVPAVAEPANDTERQESLFKTG